MYQLFSYYSVILGRKAPLIRLMGFMKLDIFENIDFDFT